MAILLNSNEPAIGRGIKTVGVGKRGSKDLPAELIKEIADDFKTGKVSPVAAGAFFGGLLMKGVAPREMILEQVFEPGVFHNFPRFMDCLAPEAPAPVKKICVDLLAQKTLAASTAYQLGKFLLSDEPGDAARGLAVSILRVRYETDDEYQGLWQSFQETMAEPFRQAVPAGDPIIQFAEPFDGVDHSYMITPLLAQYVQGLGYRAVSLVGRNSGPKSGNNLLDLIKTLNIPCAKANDDLKNCTPIFGWYFNQENLSAPLNHWVELRRQTIKRPCFATLEKFLNPAQANIIITSAFHPPYSEKMATVAQRAGFPASLVIRNGLEGTLAFSLLRPVKILGSARQKNGSYVREELTLDPENYLSSKIVMEEKFENPSLQENARLIQEFQTQGRTNNELFNSRVKLSCEGLRRALQWVEQHLTK